MTPNRRELLAGLGVGSASLLLAFGCGAPVKTIRAAPVERDDVRDWLREAVARLSSVYPHVHALAVSRRRTTAAVDILGRGIARTRRDGVVLTIRDKAGIRLEHATAELTRNGIIAAVRELAPGKLAAKDTPFPTPPPMPREPAPIADDALRNRVGAMMRLDKSGSSRIVYAAGSIDIDDVTVWSIAPGMDLEHQSRRVRKNVVRAAWNGSRPSVSEAERGWTGEVDDQRLTEAEVTGASTNAMLLVTPGAFTDGEADVVLAPAVTASIIDAAVSGLMTTTAARRPEVQKRLALGAAVASPLLTLVDDPGVFTAYGSFPFDDDGERGTPVTLLDHGHVAGRLGAGRARRPGHVGLAMPSPSHLRLDAGTSPRTDLYTKGWLLEGSIAATFDPASDRIVVAVARAKEIVAGLLTGRVFADVELVGDLSALLATVSAISVETGAISVRDSIDGEPLWRSIEAPWLRTHGTVRARRRQT